MQNFLNYLTKKPLFCALSIIFISTIFRLFFIASGQLDLSADEAQYWDWSRHLQLSYYSKGPLIAWINYFWTAIFGSTEFAVRFGAVFNSVLVQFILYYGLAKLWQRPKLAILSLLVANTMPLFLAASILMTTDSHLLVCWLIAFFAMYSLSKNPSSKLAFIAFTLSIALGILAKYTMYAFIATMLIYIFALYRQKLLCAKFVRNLCLALVLGSVIGSIPLLIWNMQNDFVGFKHVLGQAGLSSAAKSKPMLRFDTLPDYLASQFGVITPWWMILCLLACLQSCKMIFTKQEKKHPADEIRQSSILFAGFVPIWFGFLLWSLHTRIYPNWAAMSYVAGIILAASYLEKIMNGELGLKAKKCLYPCIYVSLALFLICYFAQLIPFPANYDPTSKTKGYTSLGEKLLEIEQSMPNSDKLFYFSDVYGTTAALAFYAPKQPVAYCADIGRRKNQYDYWDGPQDKIGYDAIFVRPGEYLPIAELEAMFEKTETIPFQSTHNGRKAKDFTIVKLYNYNGTWPKTDNSSY